MEKETRGTIVSVAKQWWFKVNRKPVRMHALDGAPFPHVIKVKYVVDGKEYTCRKWVNTGAEAPNVGTSVKVLYREDKHSKAKVEI